MRYQNLWVILLVLILLSATSCLPTKSSQPMNSPETHTQKIGDIPVDITRLTIMSTRKFAEISSHFEGTRLAAKKGFMYSGVNTAGIPITEERKTLFWVHTRKLPSSIKFFPHQAVLTSRTGIKHSAIMNETLHMSCASWKFPLWNRRKEVLSGFLMFPSAKEQNLKLKLPYSEKQKRGTLIYHFTGHKKSR